MQVKQQNTYIKKVLKAKKNIWVNIGMAGSNNYEVGEIFSIKKITFRKKIFLY